MACGRHLAIGEEAIWSRASRTLTCLGCGTAPLPALTEGQAGASALREYDRRRAKREKHAREQLGGLGVVLARVIDQPQSTTAWQTGSKGEGRAGERLSKHLRDHGVRLLHDRRIPNHGQANIDHIAVGPAGVLVIDTKNYKGKVRTERVSGLFSPRRTVLLINGRDQSSLIVGVERQVGHVRDALSDHPAASAVEVRGALCFPNADGLPLVSQLRVRDVVIDGPKPIAKLARRPGRLNPETVEQVWEHLARAFPPA